MEGGERRKGEGGFGRKKWRRRKAEEVFVDREGRKVASVTDSGGGGGKPNQQGEDAFRGAFVP